MNGLRSAALLLVLAAFARADSLTFRNDCRTAVVVQTATLAGGKLTADRPLVLRPGETGPAIALDGDKMVTVYDAKSNRVLFRGVQRRSPTAVSFSVQPDARAAGKAALVPRRP